MNEEDTSHADGLNGSEMPDPACESLDERLDELRKSIDDAKGKQQKWTAKSQEYERQKKELEALQGELTKVCDGYAAARQEFLHRGQRLRTFEDKTDQCFETRKEEFDHRIEGCESQVNGRTSRLCEESKTAEDAAKQAESAYDRCKAEVEELESELVKLKGLEKITRDELANLEGRQQRILDTEQECRSAVAYYWFTKFKKDYAGRERVRDGDALCREIERKACELWDKRSECVRKEAEHNAAQERAAATKQVCEEAKKQEAREAAIELCLTKDEEKEAV